MMNFEKGLRGKLDAIRDSYISNLSNKIEEAQDKWNSILIAARGSDEFIELHRAVHTLAGSCSVFGLKRLSDEARKLELLLKTLIERKDLECEETCNSISRYLTELRRLCSVGGDHRDCTLEPGAPSIVKTCALPAEREKKLIYLIEDDPLQLENLAVQIAHFGYAIKTFSRLDEAKKATSEVLPSAIIMDIIFPEGNLAGIEAIAEMKEEHGRDLPVIFISRRNDMNARLQAVRAGGDAYFIKPVNIIEIIETLDSLTIPKEPEPYKILIVDDDPDLSAHYSAILQDAGMITLVVNDPFHVMDHLIEFNPDLILTDMYMPGCNGRELALVIRQMPTYVSIPIVFLSTETDIDSHLSAMRVGGDDFLTKSIEPRHLISSIAIRAERMRIMRSFMERDGLTGLLNHTSIVCQLDLAIKRCEKQSNSFTLAMIDIDLFKSVNDTYGHSTGDRVLNSLARLLQQRLRKTDIVGRYGGEEFAVVLFDTDVKSAGKVLDEIRESFSELVHMYEEKSFCVTFSGGLASYPEYCDAISLINAADAAMYQSKKEGRNRISVASDYGC